MQVSLDGVTSQTGEKLILRLFTKHTGSLDVDLALDHTKLDEERYATILETITAKGYRKGEQVSGVGCREK